MPPIITHRAIVLIDEREATRRIENLNTAAPEIYRLYEYLARISQVFFTFSREQIKANIVSAQVFCNIIGITTRWTIRRQTIHFLERNESLTLEGIKDILSNLYTNIYTIRNEDIFEQLNIAQFQTLTLYRNIPRIITFISTHLDRQHLLNGDAINI